MVKYTKPTDSCILTRTNEVADYLGIVHSLAALQRFNVSVKQILESATRKSALMAPRFCHEPMATRSDDN